MTTVHVKTLDLRVGDVVIEASDRPFVVVKDEDNSNWIEVVVLTNERPFVQTINHVCEPFEVLRA